MSTKSYDVTTIANEFLKSPSQAQIDSLIQSTPASGYDLETIRTILGMKDKVKVVDVKKAFWESKTSIRDGCGNCDQPWGIPILSLYEHRVIQRENPRQYEWLTIPITIAPCPNCSGSQKAVALVSRLWDDERAWTWVILYDFYIHKLGNKTAPEEFYPGRIWEGMDMNATFSEAQKAIIDKIYKSSQAQNLNTLAQVQAAVVNTVRQAIAPF